MRTTPKKKDCRSCLHRKVSTGAEPCFSCIRADLETNPKSFSRWIPKQVEASIIICCDCGRLGIAIDGTRVTGHHCSGRWAHVGKDKVDAECIAAALQKARGQ
jgi:hypothetical protein